MGNYQHKVDTYTIHYKVCAIHFEPFIINHMTVTFNQVFVTTKTKSTKGYNKQTRIKTSRNCFYSTQQFKKNIWFNININNTKLTAYN